MNFIRKLFIGKNASPTTITPNTVETQGITDENSHSDINSNVLDTNSTQNYIEGEINIVNIAVEHNISEDDINELDCDKTFHNLTSVPPMEVICDTDVCKEINNNSVACKINENSDIVTNICEENLHENDVESIQNVRNDNQIIEINNPNAIDVVDLQLKEFEEVLENIDDLLTTNNLETQCSLNSNEIDEILKEIDTANEDLHDEINNNSISDETNANNNSDEKKISNNNEILDVISINSSINEDILRNEETKEPITLISDSDDSESCDGYHSSDFEFISETEARMDGFIINFRQNGPSEILEPFNEYPCQFADELFGESDPGEGTSSQNRSRNEFEDRSYRDSHQIPEGENYYQLFQGLYNPVMAVSEIYFLENKSVRTSAMNSQYDGMGFDKQLALRRHQPDSSEDEFADDAKETAGKILNMYPRENRKRRRRR
ncbi:hypothetical protein HF086_008762 [Spodoptera exigua]|uniref:Uncharacterized protein n=1 Tax=Spodoptera exigua TaxID=7107 RepID=A0A922SDJ2_SPOEX|nr:hypothetical protein HF086_008762 [Spodoptera exigua]